MGWTGLNYGEFQYIPLKTSNPLADSSCHVLHLCEVMARYAVFGFYLKKFRSFPTANSTSLRATGMESATDRWIDRRRYLPFEC